MRNIENGRQKRTLGERWRGDKNKGVRGGEEDGDIKGDRKGGGIGKKEMGRWGTGVRRTGGKCH